VLSTAYVLVTVLVAFTAALTISLERRARSELVTANLVRAQSLATEIGAENLAPGRRRTLRSIVDHAGAQLGGRVVVVDADGMLLADSQGTRLGIPFGGSGRPEIVSALTGEPTSEERRSADLGLSILATAVPIVHEVSRGTRSATVVGAVRVTQSTEQVNANVRRVIWNLVALAGAGLLAGLLLTWVVANRLSRPLVRLADTARRLGIGHLHARVGDVRVASEIEELATSFDEMATRVERSATAQREFVANASHQLRTPLTGMKLRLEAAAVGAEGDERVQIEAAEREVDRMAATVDRLLVMAREVESGAAPVTNVLQAANDAVARWSERAVVAGARATADGSPARARIDPNDLDQVLDNLLANALAYAPGPVEIGVGASGGVTVITVRDHGPGIPAEDLDRVTERFFRGSASTGPGSGLGLAIVRRLVARAGGGLALRSSDDGGLEVEVLLPVAEG
jgi:signal transduction histidine kinase